MEINILKYVLFNMCIFYIKYGSLSFALARSLYRTSTLCSLCSRVLSVQMWMHVLGGVKMCKRNFYMSGAEASIGNKVPIKIIPFILSVHVFKFNANGSTGRSTWYAYTRVRSLSRVVHCTTLLHSRSRRWRRQVVYVNYLIFFSDF